MQGARRDRISRYAPVAVLITIYALVALAAVGVCEVAKEGPDGSSDVLRGGADRRDVGNRWGANSVLPGTKAQEERVDAYAEGRAWSDITGASRSIDHPDGWISSLLYLEGGVDAYPSNVPAVPGWNGIRIPPGNDVPIMATPATGGEGLDQMEEEPIDAVVPTGGDVSTSIPGISPPPDIAGIVCAYPWDCTTAIRIVDCETGGTFDPHSVGNEDERGWFQIRFNHWDKPQCNPAHLFDPAYNTACAYSIWLDSGWGPWSCY